MDQGGRVKDQDYYHVNRIVSWSPYGLLKVGEEVDVGVATNPYFRFYETYGKTYPVTQPDGKVVHRPGVAFLKQVLSGVVNAGDLTQTAVDLASHLASHLGELVFEDIRKEEFPHLPSRQRCVWLIPTQNGVKYWLQRMNVDGQFQVLKVRIQGRLHKASESYLVGDSMPLEEAIRRARQYWLGIVEEAETEEIIFEGRMRVEEVMDKSFYA